MKCTIQITLDNPSHEEEVLIDLLGYAVDDWYDLDDSEKEQAVIEYIGVDFDDT